MNDITTHQDYYPGQVSGFFMARREALIALDGSVRVTYRDRSLDWFVSETPQVVVTLQEGESHVLPYAAFVEVRVIGHHVVSTVIQRPTPLRAALNIFDQLLCRFRRQIA